MICQMPSLNLTSRYDTDLQLLNCTKEAYCKLPVLILKSWAELEPKSQIKLIPNFKTFFFLKILPSNTAKKWTI